MASVVVEVHIKVDGEPIRGFPLVRRLSVDEIQTAKPYEKADGGGFVDLPIAELGTVQFLLIEPDQATTYQFADGAAGNIALNANGLLLLVNSNLTATPEVDNSSGNTAKIKVQAGGT
jgi:hypothetical protein